MQTTWQNVWRFLNHSLSFFAFILHIMCLILKKKLIHLSFCSMKSMELLPNNSFLTSVISRYLKSHFSKWIPNSVSLLWPTVSILIAEHIEPEDVGKCLMDYGFDGLTISWLILETLKWLNQQKIKARYTNSSFSLSSFVG